MDSNTNTGLSPVLSSTDALLELQKQQDQHQFEIAQRQIEASLQNYREQRECYKYLTIKNNRGAIIIFLVFIVLFFGFGAFALWLGKEALLSDLLKVIIGALGGGGLGYVLGSRKKDTPTSFQ